MACNVDETQARFGNHYYNSFWDLDKALCNHFQVARAHHSHVTFADLKGHPTRPTRMTGATSVKKSPSRGRVGWRACDMKVQTPNSAHFTRHCRSAPLDPSELWSSLGVEKGGRIEGRLTPLLPSQEVHVFRGFTCPMTLHNHP